MTIRRRNSKAHLPYSTLENRQMLATLVVNTVDDVVSDTDGFTSLREAIQLANADDTADVITFDAAIADQPVLLESTLPRITTEITFDGDLDDDSVADITIQGVDEISGPSSFISDIFSVSQTDVRFDGLTFSGFSSTQGSISSIIGGGGSTVSIVNSNFDGNRIAIANDVFTRTVAPIRLSASDILIDNSSFTNNFGSTAGVLLVTASSETSTLTIRDSIFDNNTGRSDQSSEGAISTGRTNVFIDNSSFTDNSGGGTGALSVLDFISSFENPGLTTQLTISNSVFTGNEGDNSAGAINTQSINTEISNTLIADNVGGGIGGGIRFVNQIPGLTSLSVLNSTISGNTAGGNGGGVAGGGSFVNTTITGNFANGIGGGILPETGALSLENSIVLGNFSTGSFGIDDDITFNANDSINFEGTNILGPNSFPDNPGFVVADPTDVFAQTEANSGNSAILAGVLADNGGAFQTVALLGDVNNPALDVGVLPGGVTTDAAGNPRSFDQVGLDNGGTVDAGAFELQTQVDVSVAAVIGGDLTGTATENFSGTGVLTISDANGQTEEAFREDTIRATYGQLSIQTNGEWTYTPFSTPITQSLREGQEVTETFTVSSVDGTTAEITLTVTGVNDVATIERAPVEISEDATEPLTGQIIVVDRDAGESEIRPSTQTGLYGEFEINAAGQWTYVLDNSAVDFIAEGFDANDFFVLTSLDGTEADFLVVVLGENDPAIIGGDLSGETDADSTNPVSGIATVVDIDTGSSDDRFQAGPLVGNFGTLDIGVNGNWSYQQNNDLTRDILLGEEVVDQITITSVDGTTAVVSITINGTFVPQPNDPLVLGTDADDTLFGSDGDDVLVGGRGSDILNGSAGDEIFFTDRINGDIFVNDRDVVDLGNLDDNATGNDVIRDFDINDGDENNFDTLNFTFLDTVFSLSTGDDILDFIDFIESDGDRGTDAVQDGADLIFVFERDSENPDIITQSVRLEDVIGDRSLTNADIAGSPTDQLGVLESDLFATDGEIIVDNGSDSSLNGGDGDDVLVGGRGSDVLIGGAGDDVLTGDQTDGGSDGLDRDVFVFGNIDEQEIGNDVITDFDTNNFRGGESNFDTATLRVGGGNFSLSTGVDFYRLVRFLGRDGNDDTGAILDGDDILFVFGRDDNGAVTESIRFKNIVGDDGLTVNRLTNGNNDIGEITNETV